MRVCFISLGCPKNLSDTEEMMGALSAAGHAVCPGLAEADAAVINTCGFLASAACESRREIAKAAALRKKGALKRLIVTGCLAQREGAAADFPAADAVLGISAAADIVRALETGGAVVRPPPRTLRAPRFRMTATLPHSVYLKVADGCDNRCSYCAIPDIRGNFRSKPLKDIAAEARALAAGGAKEISIIAQDTTSYGMDLYGKPSLVRLLGGLVKIKGPRWRIMYGYPEMIDENLVKFIAAHPQICRYMDMPVQHSADRILKLMNRRSSRETLLRAAGLLRSVPGMAIRTIMIAGFPGETPAEHEQNRQFLREVKFDSAAFFPYSPEKGTPAYSLPGQIPAAERKRRARELADTQSRVVDEINRGLIGKTAPVLMDSPSEGRLESQAPDIDGYVMVESPRPLEAGMTIRAKIISARGYVRRAVLAKDI
ncbi:MAG: MiaB/RimO family radical SAM methylthiotransferase [Elusimicrobiales bacterium]